MEIEGAWAGFYIKEDYANGFTIETVDGDTEIADGVSLVSLPGHSWGTQGLMVQLANTGTFLYTSDAVLMRESYGPPQVPDPCPWSNLEWLRSVEKVRRLAEKHNATIVFGHDSEQVDNELRLAPAFYD
jgi:glyoxylase-like metal-dependent hydrolase (beta-lactamase superfamily II)